MLGNGGSSVLSWADAGNRTPSRQRGYTRMKTTFVTMGTALICLARQYRLPFRRRLRRAVPII